MRCPRLSLSFYVGHIMKHGKQSREIRDQVYLRICNGQLLDSLHLWFLNEDRACAAEMVSLARERKRPMFLTQLREFVQRLRGEDSRGWGRIFSRYSEPIRTKPKPKPSKKKSRAKKPPITFEIRDPVTGKSFGESCASQRMNDAQDSNPWVQVVSGGAIETNRRRH